MIQSSELVLGFEYHRIISPAVRIRLERLFEEFDVSRRGKLIRPEARKFLVKAGRQNIPYVVQERIFLKRYRWTLSQLYDLLRDHGYDFDVFSDDHPFEKFCVAVELNDIPLISTMLENKCVDFSYHSAYSLFCAAENNRVEILKLLLDLGVDPSLSNPLLAASERGHLGCVRVLLAHAKVDPSQDENFAFRLACQSGFTDIVRVLLCDPRVDPAAREDFAMRLSCENNHTGVFRLLINDGRCKPHVHDNAIIQIASENSNTELVLLLLSDARVNPAANINRAIKIAAEVGSVAIVRHLLADPRVNPADDNNFALRGACQGGHQEVVKVLMACPGVNSTADQHFPLCVASQNGFHEVVKLLLKDARVDPSINDNYPFQIAADMGHVTMLRLLLTDARVDPTHFDNYAWRHSIVKNHIASVRVLLCDPRIDSPAMRHGDHLAYSKACSLGHDEIISLLLADHRLDPSFGRYKPLRDALKAGQARVARLLIAHADKEREAAEKRSMEQDHRLAQAAIEREQRKKAGLDDAPDGGLDEEDLVPLYPALYPVPLAEACEGGDSEVFKLLLTYDSGEVDDSMLAAVAALGHTELFQVLLACDGIKLTLRPLPPNQNNFEVDALVKVIDGEFTEGVTTTEEPTDNDSLDVIDSGEEIELREGVSEEENLDIDEGSDSSSDSDRDEGDVNRRNEVNNNNNNANGNPAVHAAIPLIQPVANAAEGDLAVRDIAEEVLCGASRQGHVPIVALMLADEVLHAKKDLSRAKAKALTEAVTSDKYDVVKLFLENNSIAPKHLLKSVMLAANLDHPSIVLLLLSHADVFEAVDKWELMQIACAQNQIHVARVLERYIDTSAKGFILLKFASFGLRSSPEVSRVTEFPHLIDSHLVDFSEMAEGKEAHSFFDGHVLYYLSFRLFWVRFLPFLLFLSPNSSEASMIGNMMMDVDEMVVDNSQQFSNLDEMSSMYAHLMCVAESFPMELSRHIAMLLFESLLAERFSSSDTDTAIWHAFKLAHYPHYQRK